MHVYVVQMLWRTLSFKGYTKLMMSSSLSIKDILTCIIECFPSSVLQYVSVQMKSVTTVERKWESSAAWLFSEDT